MYKTIEELKAAILRDSEENGDREFADHLGITYEELKALEYTEEKEIVDMPGGAKNLAGFKITFDEEVKPEIVEKIKAQGFSNPLHMNAGHYLALYDDLP